MYKIQVSLAHLFFNMVGLLLWFIVPVARRLPIRLALWAGAETEKYRWWAFCYIIGLFVAIPGLAFVLSLVAPILTGRVHFNIQYDFFSLVKQSLKAFYSSLSSLSS